MNTIDSVKNRFATRAILILGALVFVQVHTGAPPANRAKTSWVQSRAGQLVFFAVLEGLYRDGVGNDDVDLIIPPDEKGRPTFNHEHFVYACPLCHPAYEAFALYRQRPSFFGMKVPVDNFGPSLAADLTAGLHSSDGTQRRQAIEGLINRWVAKRLEIMRLTDAERRIITNDMEEGRKQGMATLKQSSQTRTNCPICDGGFGACKLQGR